MLHRIVAMQIKLNYLILGGGSWQFRVAISYFQNKKLMQFLYLFFGATPLMQELKQLSMHGCLVSMRYGHTITISPFICCRFIPVFSHQL